MAYTVTKDPTKPLMSAINSRLESSISAVTSVSTPSDHVWYKSVPENADIGYPRALFSIEDNPSDLVHNKDTKGIAATVDVVLWSRDRLEVVDLKADAQERLLDRGNRLSPSGWTVIDEDLTTSFPRDENRESQPDIFGRVLRIQYDMKPN